MTKTVVAYWCGDRLSWLRYLSVLSFVTMNPDWRFHLYYGQNPVKSRDWIGGETQDFLKYRGPDYWEHLRELDQVELIQWVNPYGVTNPLHERDLFRWSYLYINGGIFVDLDLLWLKAFEPIADDLSCELGLCATSEDIFLGVIAAQPRSAVIAGVLDASRCNLQAGSYHSTGTDAITKYLGRHCGIVGALIEKHQDVGICFVHPGILNPWNYMQVGMCFSDSVSEEMYEGCYAIHWWGSHPIAQEFNNRMNADTYERYDNVLARVAGKLYEGMR